MRETDGIKCEQRRPRITIVREYEPDPEACARALVALIERRDRPATSTQIKNPAE